MYMSKRLYIAGPMRGIPQYNFPVFDAARDKAIALGWDAVSPADLDRANGFDVNGFDVNKPVPEQLLREMIGRDVQEILRCDAIALLPGWQNSSGARVEICLALFCDMPILSAETFEPLLLEVGATDFTFCVRRRFGRRTFPYDDI